MRKFGFLLTGLMMTTAPIAWAQEIGVVASLKPAIDGTPPGQSTRPLTVGLDIIANERIVSSSQGSGQLLFADQTTLTIAPNSELVLDSFVYDPVRDTGEIAVSLGKGAMRFIGGRITKKSDGIIRTTNATIGVRGGMILVELLATGVRVILLAGEYVCIEGRTGRHCASRPGAVLTEDGYQGVVDPDYLAELLRRLDGEDEPDPKENRFAAGAGDIGPFDKGSLSTRGEEREDDIIENLITQDIFGDRQIGTGVVPLSHDDDDDPILTPDPVQPPQPVLPPEPTGPTGPLIGEPGEV